MLRLLATASLLFGLAPHVASAQATDAPKRGGTLIFSVTGDADTFDCHASNSVAVQHRMAPHYSLLVKIDPARYPAIAPDLAESWQESPDGKQVTFRLFDPIRFHDGTPLTSADVKATYDRLRDPPPGVISQRRNLYADVTAIETPDPRTVTFTLSRPDPAFLTKMASPWNCVYSAALLASDPTYPARRVMGSGPFRFTDRVAGSHWDGKRFEEYHRTGFPYLDGFRILDLAGPGLLNALAAGQTMTDFRGITPVQRDRLIAGRGADVKVEEIPQTANLLLTFNVTKPPFDDARVRRALSLAIDRWGAADPIGKQSPFAYVGGIVRPGAVYARSPDELAAEPGFGRDPEASRAEARRLLAEAGRPNLSFTFTNRAAYTPIGIYLIDQWRRIGVTVQHDQLENQPFFQALRSGDYVLIADSLNEYADDPTLTLARFQSFAKTPANVSRGTDAVLDDLYERITVTTDQKDRQTLVRQFEARMLSEAFSIPILWARRMVPMAAQVQGFHLTPSYYVGQDLMDIWLR